MPPDQKHIVFLTSHSSAGGAQEIWSNIAGAFAARNFRVSLCALYPYRSDIRITPPSLEWRYIAANRPGSPLAELRLLLALIRFFREERPDYAFSAMPAANVLGPLAAWLSGSRTRCFISHHTPVDTYNQKLNFVDGLVGCLANVAAIISVSNSVAGSLDAKPSIYKRKRVTIHNALPPDVETRLAALAQTRKPGSPRRRVIATGRLAEQKNYPVLIRAARHMPNAEIFIVGSGPDEEKLKALAAELGVSEQIRFLGQRTREETLTLLASGDVFVQPSLFEGHSLGLIEAAKLGLPLVVSDVPVQIEGITAANGTLCGIAVGLHDDEGLAAAIRRLLEDDAHYQIWTAQAAELAAAASFETMIGAYEALVSAN